jgi:hypothetical protein
VDVEFALLFGCFPY